VSGRLRLKEAICPEPRDIAELFAAADAVSSARQRWSGPGFKTKVAAAEGVSLRTVDRLVAVADRVPAEVRDRVVAGGFHVSRASVYGLARLPVPDQLRAVRLAETGGAPSLGSAVAIVADGPSDVPPDEHGSRVRLGLYARGPLLVQVLAPCGVSAHPPAGTPALGLEELYALRPDRTARPDVLMVWAANLTAGFRLIGAWGYTVRDSFVGLLSVPGPPRRFAGRVLHETLLVASAGRTPPPSGFPPSVWKVDPADLLGEAVRLAGHIWPGLVAGADAGGPAERVQRGRLAG